jgi:heme/copper-type cytochrome/quinol oxidase subunit 4
MDIARVSGASPPQQEPLSPLIKWVLPGGVVALTIALLGGYEFHWSWTGVTPSDQLWDLLHVIVLPVVLATLPIWYRTRQRWMMEWHLVFGVAALAFAVLVVGGYTLDWGWTGFQGNTFWDWLELLALPVVVASLPLWFATNKRFERRWRAVGLCGLAIFVVVVVGGYALDWGWTGFQGNTLWDWLRLLLVPFVLPAALAWFSARAESQREQRAHAQG